MSLAGTSFRTFVLYPVVVVALELWLNDGRLRLQAWYLPLLAWGYLQYRLSGGYRLLGTPVWMQFRVRRDELRLAQRFGEPYMKYCSRVKRWIPAVS